MQIESCLSDRNLGNYLATKTDKEIVSWERLLSDAPSDYLRGRAYQTGGGTRLRDRRASECRPEVIAAADFVYGTGGNAASRGKKLTHAISPLEPKWHAPSTQEAGTNEGVSALAETVCPNMKRTHLEDAVRRARAERIPCHCDQGCPYRRKKSPRQDA